MKRLLPLLMVFATLLPARAYDPDTDPVFYIYRNDGVFDAFRCAQVDSISFSKVDLEGVEHQNFVVQEIWVGENVSRVPIEHIDNLGFEQPEVIVSDDLFPFTAAHDQYIVAADTLSFVMSADVPKALRPVRGNIVVAEADCLSFTNGILARVTGIDVGADGNYSYACEPASLDDIYEQIVFYGTGTADVIDDDPSAPADSRRRISQEFNKEIWDKTFEGTFEKLLGTKYYANDKATCEIKICKTLGTPLYASITLNNTFTGNVHLDFSTTKDYEPEPVQLGKTLKVGRISFPHPLLANLIWLEPQIKFSGYFKAHGELDAKFAAHLNRSDAVNVTYSNKQWSISHTPKMDAAVDTANLSMRGYVEVGLIPEILLALNGSKTGIGITGKVGVKQTLDFQLDAVETYDTSVYNGLKDTHTDTWLKYSTSIFVQSGLFDKDAPRKEYTLLDREKMLFSKYLFPTFGTATYQQLSADTHLLKVQAERDVICPVRLGMRLYDEDDNFVQVSPDTLAYNRKAAATYAFTFKDIDVAKTYKAYPMVFLGPMALRATPAYTVNRCPAQIDSITLNYAYYDRSYPSAPNSMVHTVHASVRDSLPADATEWGIAIGSSLYPFESTASTGAKTFVTGVPDGVTYGSGFRIDSTNYIFEMTRTARVYVKRLNADGRETIMYSDPYTTTLRYDTKPGMTYTDPKIDSVTLVSSYQNSMGQYVQQFNAKASYTMTLYGAFWLDYIDGGISGNFSLSNNPVWRPSLDGVWRTQWDTTYLSTDKLDHSNWHYLHLRNGVTVESDRLNWVSGTSGALKEVTITPSLRSILPAATAPAKAKVTGRAKAKAGDSSKSNGRKHSQSTPAPIEFEQLSSDLPTLPNIIRLKD